MCHLYNLYLVYIEKNSSINFNHISHPKFFFVLVFSVPFSPLYSVMLALAYRCEAFV